MPVFWSRFNTKEESINKFMDDKVKEKTSPKFDGNVPKLLTEFDKVYDRIDEIQEMLAAASFFLPGYDRRISQEKIKALRDRSKALKEQSQPRKKFSFKSRRPAKKKKQKVGLPANCQNFISFFFQSKLSRQAWSVWACGSPPQPPARALGNQAHL